MTRLETGLRFLEMPEIFVCVIAFSLPLGFTQLHTGWVTGTFSPWIKRMEREAEHSRSVGAEVMLYRATVLCCSAQWRSDR